MSNDRAALVNGLRGHGHAVVDELSAWTGRRGVPVERAARFVEAALTVADRVRPGRAYVRLSVARGLVLVEVTHLEPGSFDALMVDDAAIIALEDLKVWAAEFGRGLTIERGPRDQFRVTVVFKPDVDDSRRRGASAA
jgi:hypothetical protein